MPIMSESWSPSTPKGKHQYGLISLGFSDEETWPYLPQNISPRHCKHCQRQRTFETLNPDMMSVMSDASSYHFRDSPPPGSVSSAADAQEDKDYAALRKKAFQRQEVLAIVCDVVSHF